VLDHVKQTNRRKSPWQYASVFQGRPYHMPYTAFDGIPNPRKSWLNEDHFKAGLLHCARDTTVSAADIKDGSLWREEFHRFQNAAISVLKPK